MMNFYIIFYFLEIFCSYYFIRIKKLRFYILFTNQIEAYISFLFLFIPPKDSLKFLNFMGIQLVYYSELIDYAQQCWNFGRYKSKSAGMINKINIKAY